MADDQRRRAETEGPEDEGIPDLDPALPAKERTGDAQEGQVLPRDHSRATERTGVTGAEQREGASLDERLAEEEDEQARSREQAGRLVEEGTGLTDQEKDEVADEAEEDQQGLSAEEAAVRVEDDAPGGVDRSDSYVQEE
jgi:hypothetical protein